MRKPPMTIEQFRTSGKTVKVLPEVETREQDDSLGTVGGRVYCNCLVIEDTRTWSPQSQEYARNHGPTGRWYLCIGRSEYVSDDLADLEAILYEYALAEQFTA